MIKEFLSPDAFQKEAGISHWVKAADNNQPLYLQRQAIAVLLAAIGLDDQLSENLVLKGGTLMSIAFKSERATGDVDLTGFNADITLEHLHDTLDGLMRRAAATIGYATLRCQVQTIKKQPKAEGFPENFNAPALAVTIAYTQAGSKEEERLNRGNASSVIQVDISFKECVFQKTDLHLHYPGIKISAYSITDILAEKLRATIQQVKRSHVRNRRQDIYDIAFLLNNNSIKEDDKANILTAFLAKCAVRNLTVDQHSLDDPAIKAASQKEWETIYLEVSELPDFENCFTLVHDFY